MDRAAGKTARVLVKTIRIWDWKPSRVRGALVVVRPVPNTRIPPA